MKIKENNRETHSSLNSGKGKPAVWLHLLLPLLLILSFVCCAQTVLAYNYGTPDKSEPLLTRAKKHLLHEDYEEALSEYRQFAKLQPKNYLGFLGIGDCLYYLGDYPSALDAVNAAISLNSKAGLAYRRKGKICLKMQQADVALDAYTKAIAIEPNSTLFLNERSEIYYKKGELGKALADLNKSLPLMDESRAKAMALYSRSVLLTKMGKKADADADRKRADLLIMNAY